MVLTSERRARGSPLLPDVARLGSLRTYLDYVITYDECAVQLELTLVLALTETLMLEVALSEASAAVPAHAIALPPKVPDASRTAFPDAETFCNARTASGPWVLAASRSFGKLASTVVFSLARSPAASTLKARVIAMGWQIIFAEACPLQLDSQFASTVQTGGVSSVSHFGWVAVPMHPPLQATLAPQFMLAVASSLHSPLHLPLQLDEHLPWHMAAG
jgi:hypothetical protein